MVDEKIEAMLAPHAKIVELLCTIPGVALRTAQVLIAECGLDMSRFPTAAHLASWAGICPAITSPPDADAPGAPGQARSG